MSTPMSSRVGNADGSSRSRNALRDARVRVKMSGLIVLAALVAAAIAIVGQTALGAAQQSTTELANHEAKPALTLSRVALDWARYRRFVLTLVADQGSAQIQATDAKLTDNRSKAESDLAAYIASGLAGNDQVAADKIKTDMATAMNVFDTRIAEAAKHTLTLAQVGQVTTTVNREFTPIADQTSQEIDAQVAVETANIDVRLQQENAKARTQTVILWVAAAVGMALVALAGLWISSLLVTPVTRVRDALQRMAEGDLTVDPDVHTGDELGEMAQALRQALASLREAMGSISSSSVTLAGSAEELSAVSAQVASGAEQTSAESGTAAAAAEQVSRSVQTVAAATEEMTASIGEIAANSAEAARVAQAATGEAAEASRTIAQLGESSREVGDVVKVITSIAEQTNLLALNATIEAARAGEAGKGFAVVASEVKDLAQETGRATEDISRRIESIQSDTDAAVGAVERIARIIDEINSYQTTIASAVEEQTSTTSEMARSVNEAAGGAGSIAQSLEQVAGSARSSSEGIAETQRSAGELAQLSAQLRSLVGQFRV